MNQALAEDVKTIMELRSAPIRFIHTADIHLEARFRGLPLAKRKLRRTGLRKTFLRIVDKAIERQVDALLIAGDLFDSAVPGRDTVNFVTGAFQKLDQNGIPVLIVPGNHDHLADDSVWSDHGFPGNVKVFTNDKWERAELKDGVSVYGIGCDSFSSDRNVITELKPDRGPGRKLALMHGSLDYGFFGGDLCYPFNLKDLENKPLDYLALGHYHNAELESAVARYSGSPEGLKSSEAGKRSALLVELDGKRLNIEEIDSGAYIYRTKEVDCTLIDGSERIKSEILELEDPKSLVTVVLKGSPPLELDIDPDALVSELRDRFFSLEIKANLSLPDLSNQDDNSVRGIFISRLTEKIKTAGEQDEAEKIKLALRLGLAALDGRLK